MWHYGVLAVNKPSPIDQILSRTEVREITPASDMTLWRWEQAGLFPKRIKLGKRRIGWSLSEVQDWIEARKQERNVMAHAQKLGSRK